MAEYRNVRVKTTSGVKDVKLRLVSREELEKRLAEEQAAAELAETAEDAEE